MSIWTCPEHGVTGPRACCAKASRAVLGQSIPTPPSPEPPREREGARIIQAARNEIARLCVGRGRMTYNSRLAGRDWTMCIPRRDDDSDAIFADLADLAARLLSERIAAASLPPSAGTMETGGRFDDPVEEIIATLEGGPTVADARKPLALRITHAIHLLRKLHPKPAPPSAGSGETELDRLTAYIAGFIEAIDAKPDDDGYAEAVAYATEKASAWLAAHPAGTTRKTPHPDLVASACMESPLEQIGPDREAEMCALEEEAKRCAIEAEGRERGDSEC